MRDSTKSVIDKYTKDGTPPGGFLTAVFANDLFSAIGSADEHSTKDFVEIVSYVTARAPIECLGSRGNVHAWIAKRGMEAYANEPIVLSPFRSELDGL